MTTSLVLCLCCIVPRVHFAHFTDVVCTGVDIKNSVVEIGIIALKKTKVLKELAQTDILQCDPTYLIKPSELFVRRKGTRWHPLAKV